MNLKAVRKNLSIISILLGGLTLRLISINQSLWLDEATSAVLVRDFSFPDILTKFSPGDFHPPLYYILLKFWSTIFGTSEIRLRSLSVVVGVGGIYLTYLLARMLFNKKIALVSSLLLATSGLHIYFSQEARMYVLASTFVLLTIFYFVKTIGDGRVGDLVLFSVFLYLSVMTNYITVFIIPVFWIYGYLKRKNKYWFKKLFMSHIILGVFGVLWLPTFLKQLSIGANVRILFPIWWATLGKTNFKDVLLVPVKFMIGRVSWDNKILYGFIVVSLFIFFGLLIYDGYQKHKGNQRYYFVLLWLGVPYLLALVFGLWFSVFSYFRLLYLLPAFYILISLGLYLLKIRFLELMKSLLNRFSD